MPEVVGRYDYVAEDEALLFQVERLKPKGFRQRRSDGNGGWIYNLNGTRRVLYRLPKVIEAVRANKRVVVVEGEKDVHALEEKGAVATTSPGGAGKWLPEFNEVLRGARVMIISDADDPGRRHALSVACELDCVVADLRIYEPASPHKDISDHLKAGLTSKQLVPFDRSAVQAALGERNGNEHANGNGNGRAYRKLCLMTADEVMAMPDPPKENELVGPVLYRGHRLMILAGEGTGKTTFTYQLMAAAVYAKDFLDWKGAGGDTNILVFEGEQSRKSVKRVWAQSGLADAGSRACLVYEPDGILLDKDPGAIAYIEDVLASRTWHAVAFDPAQAFWGASLLDEEQVRRYMALLDSWRRRFDFAEVVPHHIRKPPTGAKFTIDEGFGSKAFVWGAESVLGLRRQGNGASDLHWFKDREGDLPELRSRWPLRYDREHGYRRALGEQKVSTKDKVRVVLTEAPGITEDELWFRLGGTEGPAHRTIRNALLDLGATHDGERLVKDRRYFLPPTLFEEGSSNGQS